MNLDVEKLLTNLYNSFDPFQPLPAGDPLYVDCTKVRGDGDVLVDLGRKIRRSKRMTCQLYAGHRGAGKSTELLRLKQHLEEQKVFVVYFAADEQDIDAEDAEYTDILLACTRHLLQDLKDIAKPNPILNWLEDRWQELKDLALTEVDFDKASIDVQIAAFAKLTANLRAVPSLRHQIRQKINPHTVTLIKVLNEFIEDAKNNLPNGCTELAVIVDNLDRVVPVIQEDNRTNHDHIFIDRSEQLKGLNCHIIYTVPISMVYSHRSADLREFYTAPQVLPMIMIQKLDGSIHEPGFNKVKELIAKRVEKFAPNFSLETDIFDSEETLNRLCLMSGGHVRNLLLLIQSAFDYTDDLPIPINAIRRSITDVRDTYRKTVDDDQWMRLAEVAISKYIPNDDDYRSLMFNRCILEYCYHDGEGGRQRWYDVHPLIKGIPEFKKAVESVNHKV